MAVGFVVLWIELPVAAWVCVLVCVLPWSLSWVRGLRVLWGLSELGLGSGFGLWWLWSLGGCRDEQGCGCLASGGFAAPEGVNVSGLDCSPKWSLFQELKPLA